MEQPERMAESSWWSEPRPAKRTLDISELICSSRPTELSRSAVHEPRGTVTGGGGGDGGGNGGACTGGGGGDGEGGGGRRVAEGGGDGDGGGGRLVADPPPEEVRHAAGHRAWLCRHRRRM